MENLEIERKFLVKKELWEALEKPAGTEYLQGYLCIDDDKVIRARVAGDKGFLTIKGTSETFSHPEFEYNIPVEEAARLINLFSKSQVKKIRRKIALCGHIWEVDEFCGENEGLLLAEIELNHPDEDFEKPAWLGAEVTGDERYYNASLSVNSWKPR